ncbi:hypothetical protein [Nocardiopsis synnemataformans]|uniref:hypothetical protein n=1 Tax=Nocardiopsis synnemataformans TaxID=61305 RepID=UPI003EBC948E
MPLAFTDVTEGVVLTFINNHSDGRTKRQSFHTAKVTKVTGRTVFLEDLERTVPAFGGGTRPVRYRLTRSNWDRRQVHHVTTASGLPRRPRTTASRIAQAAIPAVPERPLVRDLVTVTTQGGPIRVHSRGCTDIRRDVRAWRSTPRAVRVADRVSLIWPMVADILAEDPNLDVAYYDDPEEFHFLPCCGRLPWKAAGASYGHYPTESPRPGVQHVIQVLTRAGHVPATFLGVPEEQPTGFVARSYGDHVEVLHLQDGHTVAPGTGRGHREQLAAYARTLTEAGLRPHNLLRLISVPLHDRALQPA